MGSKKQKVPVADYLMSIHYAICKGPLDAINQLYVKDKVLWCGRIDTATTITSDRPGMFGGDRKEGGTLGAVDCFLGTADQLATPELAARFSRTPANMPANRGIAALFFRGLAGGGFKWLSNNPYLPGVWANVTRLPSSLTNSFKAIYEVDPPSGGSIIDGVGERFPVTLTALETWFEFDLLSLGIPAFKIDEGLEAGGVLENPSDIEKGVRLHFDVEVVFPGFVPGTSGSTTYEYDVEFYSEAVAPEFLLGEGFVGSTSFTGEITGGSDYHFRVAVSDNVPKFCRFVRARIRHTDEIANFVSGSSDSYFIYGSGADPEAHCGENNLGKLPSANPAHMIFEALTDRDWGMGSPVSLIDLPSFLAAAELFHTERFGLSIVWAKQAEINAYISEILDHVQANLFMDPSTGLWTLVPLRGGYDVDTLPVLDPTNCTAKNRQRKAFGEIVNEIVVTWTNPNNEKEETVSLQDLAAIAAQDGETVSATRNYYGVRNAKLAMQLCARDLRAAAYPIWGCDIVANRSMAFLRPGSVVKINWPEDGIVGMVVRVGKIDYGKPGDSSVKFPVTEDVFALDVAQYTGVQDSLWDSPVVDPSPMPYAQPLTAPLPLLLRSGFADSDLTDADYPRVVNAILADHDISVEYVDLTGPVTLPNGSVEIESLGTILPTPSARVPTAMLAEPESTLPAAVIAAIAAPQFPQPGGFIYLSLDGTDATSEVIMLDTFDGTEWTIARGMFDTLPRRWLHSSRAWYLGSDLDARDPEDRAALAPVEYQLRTKTTGGLLPLASTPVIEFTPSERPYLPFRPADVAFVPDDGTPITASLPAEAGALVPLVYWLGDQPTSGVASWKNRNRLSEDSVAPHWTAGTITPEPGQSTTIRVRDLVTDTVLDEVTGLTSTSSSVDLTAITTVGRYAIEVLSVRAGFESLQFASQLVNVIENGYGNAYGLDYSG